uniref:Uncharacterized protein n=1 Tax=Rhizophora mucronata TaxID=61149 RepID=A0A2P2NVF4_RHIMU
MCLQNCFTLCNCVICDLTIETYQISLAWLFI